MRGPSGQEYVDALRLGRDEILRILGAHSVRAAHGGGRGRERRSEPRRACGAYPVALLEIMHPHGYPGRYRTVVRDISTRGIGLLHGNFVYTGRQCRVTLKGRSGTLVTLAATLVRCQHVEGRVHELGLQFDTPINLDELELEPQPETKSASE